MNIPIWPMADFVVSQANVDYEPELVQNEERLEQFKQYCALFDKAINKNEADEINIKVDGTSVCITATVPELLVDDDETTALTELIAESESVAFECIDADSIRMTLVFSDLWGETD